MERDLNMTGLGRDSQQEEKGVCVGNPCREEVN